MKFNYYFVTKEKVTIDIEISEELEKVLEKDRKEESRKTREHSRKTWSYSSILYEGSEYGREDLYIFEDEEEKEKNERTQRIENAMEHLSESQRTRLLLYIDGSSYTEIASIECISVEAASRSVERAIARFKRFFEIF